MDPITIGTTIGVAVVARLTKQLMEKAADPENIAKGVNWVFSAANHFLKVRRGEQSRNEPLTAPPAPKPSVKQSTEVDELLVEEKASSVQEIAKSLERESQTPLNDGIHMIDIDSYAMDQLASEVESLMNQLDVYLGNLRFEEEKAAQFGGLAFAPPIVMNTIRIQQEEIAKRVVRLNNAMQQAFGFSAPNLEALVLASKERN